MVNISNNLREIIYCGNFNTIKLIKDFKIFNSHNLRATKQWKIRTKIILYKDIPGSGLTITEKQLLIEFTFKIVENGDKKDQSLHFITPNPWNIPALEWNKILVKITKEFEEFLEFREEMFTGSRLINNPVIGRIKNPEKLKETTTDEPQWMGRDDVDEHTIEVEENETESVHDSIARAVYSHYNP